MLKCEIEVRDPAFIDCVRNNEFVYLNGVRIKNEAGKWAALDVLSLVGDGNLPFASFIRLESGRVNPVVVGDRTVEYAVGWRFGLHFKRPSAGAI